MKIYTSEEILAMEDLHQLQELSSNLAYPEYKLTNEEIGWWNYVKGRYSIADHLRDWTYEDADGNIILRLEAESIGKALSEDGMFPKAVCLSDDTALQKIFFWCAEEPMEVDIQ